MVQLKVYEDPQLFWNEVSPHLRKAEAKNCLCLGLAYNFQFNSKDCLYQSALFKDGELKGALVLSRYLTNHNFLPSPVAEAETAEKLFKEFKKANIALTGIVGEKATATLYKDLVESNGQKTKVNMIQGVYRCRKVTMPKGAEGLRFRAAGLEDIQKVGEWIEAFQQEAVPHDPPVIGVEMAKAKIDNQMIYLVENNNELVSMAAWSRDIKTSCAVNLVYTPKHLRKKGYASVVTAMLTQHLLNQGKVETNLFTDMTNPTSNKIYMDIGYEFVCDSIHFGVI